MWKAGLSHPTSPHVTSSNQEGAWNPEFGYLWNNDASKDLTVHWASGVERSDFPKVFSSPTEGYWLAKPGYEFQATDSKAAFEITSGDRLSSVQAVWAPGKSHPVCEYIKASSAEGSWVPKDGYQFISKDSLTVRPITYASYTSMTPDISSELLVGTPACIAAMSNKGEGFWGQVTKYVEEKVCGAAVESGAQKLSGQVPTSSSENSADIPCDYWNTKWNKSALEAI